MTAADLLARPLARELLEAPLVASLATLEADGSAHVVPIWYLWDGKAVLMATSSTSRKVRNLERDPRATVMIHDSPGGVDVRGITLAGRAEIRRGEDVAAAIHAVHLRYVTANGLATPSVREFLAGDDVILRFAPGSGSSWDSTTNDAARDLRRSGEYVDSSRVAR
jgi:PPOX class probable F420-dependent enzyme